MQKTCTRCSAPFEVSDEDLAFYEKASPILAGKQFLIAPPSFCPECRRQRRLSWRNERTYYKRSCDFCRAIVVSIHAPDHIYPVYCNPCYWSENWDPLSYGVDFDLNRSFLEQFYELYERVPQRAMVNENGITSENSEYTIDVPFAKNCYMCSGMWKAENCYYCRICDQSKFCVDCEGVKLTSELVYDSVDSQKLYRCKYIQNSESCRDCIFGFNLKGCSNCIACCGLRQQQYSIFNKSYSKEEYYQTLKSFRLDTHEGVDNLRKKYEIYIMQFPRKNMNLQNCEDSSGDHLFNCKQVQGFVCTNSEYSKWVERSDGPIWSYDITQSGNCQWCLECITVDNGYGNICAIYSNQSKYVLYSENCFSCKSLLGCISLRKNRYCILNKQYSEEEYNHIASVVLDRMQKDKEFVEFFSSQKSPFAYNETNANEFYPLTKEEVLARGWKWKDKLPYTTGKETIQMSTLPESIHDTNESIIQNVFACINCLRNFRIVEPEYHFYKDMEIPLPRYCPECRNTIRLSRRNPHKLFNSTCAKCSKDIQTTYSPERPEIVYCEECYLNEVY